jgi:hypothetical protein
MNTTSTLEPSPAHAAAHLVQVITAHLVFWPGLVLFRRRQQLFPIGRVPWGSYVSAMFWVGGNFLPAMSWFGDSIPCGLPYAHMFHCAAITTVAVSARLWHLNFRFYATKAVRQGKDLASNWYIRNRRFAKDSFLTTIAFFAHIGMAASTIPLYLFTEPSSLTFAPVTSPQCEARPALFFYFIVLICVTVMTVAFKVREIQEGMRMKSELGAIAGCAILTLSVWWFVCRTFTCLNYFIGWYTTTTLVCYLWWPVYLSYKSGSRRSSPAASLDGKGIMLYGSHSPDAPSIGVALPEFASMSDVDAAGGDSSAAISVGALKTGFKQPAGHAKVKIAVQIKKPAAAKQSTEPAKGAGPAVFSIPVAADETPKDQALRMKLHAASKGDPNPICKDILISPIGYASFEKHVASEFSLENLQFWREVRKYRSKVKKGSSRCSFASAQMFFQESFRR